MFDVYDSLLSLIVFLVLWGGYYCSLQGHLMMIRYQYPNMRYFKKSTVLMALILSLLTICYYDISIHIKVLK